MIILRFVYNALLFLAALFAFSLIATRDNYYAFISGIVSALLLAAIFYALEQILCVLNGIHEVLEDTLYEDEDEPEDNEAEIDTETQD